MNCFPCFRKDEENNNEEVPVAQAKAVAPTPQHVESKSNQATEVNNKKEDSTAVTPDAKTFTFRELATATKHFRQECLLSEGGSGRVFKATLQSGQVVAVKQLDKNSTQGNKDFLAEVTVLSLLHHPNLLTLIGYCADGDQRLLVYEYFAVGSVEDHLLDPKPEKKRLDWATRMKIANGAAEALEYLHEKANPPVIYRDLKSSNIMLDEQFNPKLSDYGLAKLGGNNSHVTPRVMGNYGYCAPEYERSGELTVKSDVYSFGVILLELITGRRALDTSRPADEQNLVSWAQPFFKDPKRFPEMADPFLENAFPVKSLNQAVGVAAMCLQDEPDVRPYISDIVAALSFLAMAPPVQPNPVPVAPQAPANQPSGDRSLNSATNNPMEDPDQVAGSVDAGSKGDKPEQSKDNDEDQDGSEYESGDSYGSSEYEDDEDFTSYEQGTDTNEGHQQGEEELDFEVASMSGSEDESQPGSISRRYGSKTNNSLNLKRKSTKKSHQGSARFSSGGGSGDDTWHESSSQGNNSQRESGHLGSRESSIRSKSRNVDSSGSQKKSQRSKNRSKSTYRRDNNGNMESGKRRSKSAYYKNKESEEKE